MAQFALAVSRYVQCRTALAGSCDVTIVNLSIGPGLFLVAAVDKAGSNAAAAHAGADGCAYTAGIDITFMFGADIRFPGVLYLNPVYLGAGRAGQFIPDTAARQGSSSATTGSLNRRRHICAGHALFRHCLHFKVLRPDIIFRLLSWMIFIYSGRLALHLCPYRAGDRTPLPGQAYRRTAAAASSSGYTFIISIVFGPDCNISVLILLLIQIYIFI